MGVSRLRLFSLLLKKNNKRGVSFVLEAGEFENSGIGQIKVVQFYFWIE